MSFFGAFLTKIRSATDVFHNFDVPRGLIARNYWEPQPNPKETWSEAVTFCNKIGMKSKVRPGILKQNNEIVGFIYEKGHGRVTWTHVEAMHNEKDEGRAIAACLEKIKEKVADDEGKN